MLDIDDDAKGDFRRVEVRARADRRWLAAEKAEIVRQTLVPGVRISEVARRWQMDPQQLYRWRHSEGVTHRRPMRRSRQVAEADFVPIIAGAMPAGVAAPVIEVRLAGAVVRVMSDLDGAQLTMVLRAVRASALGA